MTIKMVFAGHDCVDTKVCVITGDNVPNKFEVFSEKSQESLSGKLSEFFGCTFAGEEFRKKFSYHTEDVVDSLSGSCYTLILEERIYE